MNIVEKLSREIERVTIIRAAWMTADFMRAQTRIVNDDCDVDFSLRIDEMTAAIEAGHHAAGGGDPLEIIAAVGRLQGFKE